jgi:hypothetical protein
MWKRKGDGDDDPVNPLSHISISLGKAVQRSPIRNIATVEQLSENLVTRKVERSAIPKRA